MGWGNVFGPAGVLRRRHAIDGPAGRPTCPALPNPGDMTDAMADKTIIALRETAAAYAEAVRTTQRFFDHLEDTEDPSALVEYATLAEREKEAAEARLDAIEAAGLEAPSIDESDSDS